MSPDAILALLKLRAEFTSRYDPDSWIFLGAGAFAVVARVQSLVLDQPVALKVFHRFDRTIKRRLQAEVTNTQRILSHAVVQVYTAFFLDDDTAWLEMESVDGPDLQRELERREQEACPFTTTEALDLALAATIPVAEAHAVGVIHRDIKPSNYLLPSSRAPLLKLGDFGISKHLQDARLTGTGQFPGTPSWACPEAYDGHPLGTPADVYNLAALAFLLLANRPAYDLPRRATPNQWLAAHRHLAPRRVRDFRPEVHPALEDALRRSLHKDPARRLPLPDLVAAIRSAQLPQATGASSHSPPARRRLRMAVAGMSLALVLFGLAALAISHAPRPSAPLASSSSISLPLPVSPTPSASEARPAEAASPAPERITAGPAAKPRRHGFRVELDAEWLTLTNATGGRVAEISVTIVGPDGALATAATSGVLAPGEEITFPLSAFSPRPTWPPKDVLVSADALGGRQAFPVSPRNSAIAMDTK
ncbi:MAG TPA: serine/threonine-protein kinase [Vicinamibacteria bacterium]|nr:serine/threonine-protein kinase [Vicinamibacteria bacterium]